MKLDLVRLMSYDLEIYTQNPINRSLKLPCCLNDKFFSGEDITRPIKQ